MAREKVPVVFLVDVDNTLLDNDAIEADLKRHLERTVGRARRRQYWMLFERLRRKLGYADYLGALQDCRNEHPRDPGLLTISSFLIDYPFAKRLYPGALEVLKRLRRRGAAVILTDGDVVFQPRKIERSGIAKAAGGRVLVYIHKERALGDVARRYPAARYVLIDDKLRILAAVKKIWGRRVTTVFPRQGHYARDPRNLAAFPPADITINRIGDLLERKLPIGSA
ncbi:MAG TPA: HAD family hydrolase [Elusimicrobiota bacterium]|nr:HAD family hydrolase [Elusimicrobiota bacterium]